MSKARKNGVIEIKLKEHGLTATGVDLYNVFWFQS